MKNLLAISTFLFLAKVSFAQRDTIYKGNCRKGCTLRKNTEDRILHS